MRCRHEHVPRPPRCDGSCATSTADACCRIPGVLSWGDGQTTRDCSRLANESKLADRTERAILPRNRNRLAVAPVDVLDTRFGLAVSPPFLPGTLAAKAPTQH